MAIKQEVKIYLAHWFQLGKTVVSNRDNVILLPKKVITGNSYSREFEQSWQRIISSKTSDYYLEGTHQTIQELLTPAWEIVNCSRCDMPVAMHSIGMPAAICPCYYLTNWPNTEVPSPRCPIDSQIYLQQIRDRLIENSETPSC
ncbi:MAG: hypothetical protein HRU34_02830 [Richelia sp.]|nr:hypothetical protein [Richelia sp.]CDN11530.1 hypothetical protein RintRC_1739 [Richelia intracellularis]